MARLASDTIYVTYGSDSRYTVTINGRMAGRFPAHGVTKILINGFAGDDRITLDSNVTVPSEIHGGEGNDTLQGGGGSNIISGGDGRDTLKGGSVRDVLFGGSGSDTIVGNGGDDLVVSGATFVRYPVNRAMGDPRRVEFVARLFHAHQEHRQRHGQPQSLQSQFLPHQRYRP